MIAKKLELDNHNVLLYDCEDSKDIMDSENRFKNREIIKSRFNTLIKDIPKEIYKEFLIIFDHIDIIFIFEPSDHINYLFFRKTNFFSLGGTILLIFNRDETISFNFKCAKNLELKKPSIESFSKFIKSDYNEVSIDDFSKIKDYKDLINHINYIKSIKG